MPVLSPGSRALAALLLCLAPTAARAGNDEGVLLGNEAALTGGALTANVSDGSALWYNPAGLASASQTDSVDVTASAFMLRRYRMPSLLSSNDGQGSGSFTEVVTIPSALTYLRRLSPRATLGLGLFSPQVNDVVLRSALQTSGNLDTSWQLLLAQKQSQYYAAAGLGFALHPRVSLGLTVMGGYFNAVTSSQVTGAVTDPTSGGLVVFSAQSLRDEVTALGLEARLGVMARLHRALSLGASLSLPGMTFYGARRQQGFQGVGASPDAGIAQDFAPVDEDKSGGQVGVYSPFKARLGLSYRPAWGGVLSADTDFASRAKNSELDVDRVFTWNARIGGYAPVSERLVIGAGLFTDRGPDRKAADGTGPVHFYGCTLGGTYSTVRKLAPGERREALTFATTAAVRYAHGTGKALGFYFDGDTGDNFEQAVPLKVDEISLHLGSSMYF